jgi:hypothetical protein
MKKSVLRAKGQVSLEMLMLALVILLFSASVLSYYTQISNSTMAMYLLDIEVLKEIDRTGEVVVKEGIEYRIDTATSTLDLCLFTKSTSGNNLLSVAKIASIENNIQDKTSFPAVNLFENPASPTPCD